MKGMMMVSNRDSLKLFLINNGDVAPATASAEWDGIESILVAATSDGGALKVAAAYDSGMVGADNMMWDGQIIAVVCLRDNDTGLYV